MRALSENGLCRADVFISEKRRPEESRERRQSLRQYIVQESGGEIVGFLVILVNNRKPNKFWLG